MGTESAHHPATSSSHKKDAENDHHQGKYPPIAIEKFISKHVYHLLKKNNLAHIDEGRCRRDTLFL